MEYRTQRLDDAAMLVALGARIANVVAGRGGKGEVVVDLAPLTRESALRAIDDLRRVVADVDLEPRAIIAALKDASRGSPTMLAHALSERERAKNDVLALRN